MSYDLNAAKAQLANLVQGTFTQDDLVNLAKQVDITAEGSVTVLYSKMGSDPNIRILDKTDAFEFLTSDDFQRALGQTKGVSLAQMKDPSFISPEKTALLNWNYDGTAGPWAGISKNFAEATVGCPHHDKRTQYERRK
ncbi:MAG: hypothetical protein EPN89_13160 [Methylovulum sp.]|nr:MAG: hypothetical protein EPN89_13160 [Methylovulum sp.]